MTACSDTCHAILKILSVEFAIGCIVMGSIGAAYYVRDKHDETVLKSTLCYITNTYIDSSDSTDADGHTTCISYRVFLVQYNTSDGQKINSTISNGSPNDYIVI